MNRIETKQDSSQRQRGRNSENPVHSVKISSLTTALLHWFTANARNLPWRRTLDPYAVWVSEIMLQQTQVKTVIPYFDRWMAELPTIQALAEASSERIHKLWEGLGYYTRVRNMQKAAQVIVEKHNGKLPRSYDDVLALPGIGRYTAGAICSIAFNQPTPILDGNVMRVLARLFAIRENVREKETNARLWRIAEALVGSEVLETDGSDGGLRLRERLRIPTGRHDCRNRHLSLNLIPPSAVRLAGNCSALNQSLMELGALVCTPRDPKCAVCPVMKNCSARKLGLLNELPNVGQRAAATQRRFLACVVERDGAVLVRRRPAGVVNAHLWEFPNVEAPLKLPAQRSRLGLEAEIGCALESFVPLTTVKHTITRYRVTLEAFRGGLNGAWPRDDAGKWIPREELEGLAFTSAHRRVLKAMLSEPEENPAGGP